MHSRHKSNRAMISRTQEMLPRVDGSGASEALLTRVRFPCTTDVETPMELLIYVDTKGNLYSPILALTLNVEGEALTDEMNHCGGREEVLR